MAEKKSARLGYEDLRKLKEPAQLAPCYLLCGDEDYLKENALELLKKLALADGDETFNYRRLDGPNVDMDALSEAVEAFPEMPEFAAMADVAVAGPNEPRELRTLYTGARPFTKLPKVPEPYDTFANTFSYGAESQEALQ